MIALSLTIALASLGAGEGVQVGEEAPRFTLRAIVGEGTVSLGEVLAARPRKVAVSFAASYCEPCLRELEALPARLPSLAERGVSVIVVAIDRDPEGIEKISERLRRLGLGALAGVDRLGLVARRYRVERLPTFVEIDAEGRIAGVQIGYEGDPFDALTRRLGASPP